MDRVQPNFVNILALTRSMLGFYVLFFANLQKSYGLWLVSIPSDSTIAGL